MASPGGRRKRCLWLPVALVSLAAVSPQLACAQSESTLRDEADRAGINLGSAAQYWMPGQDADYVDLLDRHVNTISFENEAKWRAIHPQPDTYDFSYADTLAEWARAHGMHMRGHTLVWFSRAPDWLKALDPTREEAIAILRDHIDTVVGHFRDKYPGLVTQWDVVNEEMDNDGTLRNSLWHRWIGEDYIDLAFRFAREAAGPDVKLFYNDYFDDAAMAGAEAAGGDSDDGDPTPMTTPGATGARACAEVIKCVAVKKLVSGMVKRGVPIDGVGFEAHMFSPMPSDYRALTAWVGKLGLEWALTEMDRPITPVNETTLADQAAAVATAAQSCIDDPACNTIVFWGLADRYTWLKAASGGRWVNALPFGEDLEAKPAADRLHDVLAAAPSPATDSTAPYELTGSPAATGLRAAALRKCRKLNRRKARRRCAKRARRLPA